MQLSFVREHGRWGACETGAECVRKKTPYVRSETDSSHRKKALKPPEKRDSLAPSLLPSPLHTHSHTHTHVHTPVQTNFVVTVMDPGAVATAESKRLQLCFTSWMSDYIHHLLPNITPIWCYWLWVRHPMSCKIWRNIRRGDTETHETHKAAVKASTVSCSLIWKTISNEWLCWIFFICKVFSNSRKINSKLDLLPKSKQNK